jgi:hypothetical protein
MLKHKIQNIKKSDRSEFIWPFAGKLGWKKIGKRSIASHAKKLQKEQATFLGSFYACKSF